MTTPHSPQASTLFLEDIRSPHAPERRAAFRWLERVGSKLPLGVVTELCRALETDTDPEVRLRAAGVVGRSGKDMTFEARTALLRALGDPDERVRCAVVDALGSLGTTAPKRVIEALVAVAREPEGMVSRNAAAVLAQMGALPADLAMPA